jgi:hypothetical protein
LRQEKIETDMDETGSRAKERLIERNREKRETHRERR